MWHNPTQQVGSEFLSLEFYIQLEFLKLETQAETQPVASDVGKKFHVELEF